MNKYCALITKEFSNIEKNAFLEKRVGKAKKILLWISFQALCAWSRDPQFPWAPNEALAKAQITSSISALGVHFFLDILI